MSEENNIPEPSRIDFVAEPIAVGVATILGSIPLLSVASTTAFSIWQTRNYQKFARAVQDNFNRIGQTKLDKTYLESDEFKGLVIQSVEASIRSASDQKCNALANALLNSVVQPTSQFSNKPAILRVISQMTDEEISVLKVLHDYEPSDKSPTSFMATVYVAEALNLSKPDVLTSLDGLQQLGLAYDFVQVFAGEESRRTHWRITTLGYRSSQYAMNSVDLT